MKPNTDQKDKKEQQTRRLFLQTDNSVRERTTGGKNPPKQQDDTDFKKLKIVLK